jgi:hypothetical protein
MVQKQTEELVVGIGNFTSSMQVKMMVMIQMIMLTTTTTTTIIIIIIICRDQKVNADCVKNMKRLLTT